MGDFDYPRFHYSVLIFSTFIFLYVSKNSKCSLKLIELKNNIKKFDEKYGKHYKKELETYIKLEELKKNINIEALVQLARIEVLQISDFGSFPKCSTNYQSIMAI